MPRLRAPSRLLNESLFLDVTHTYESNFTCSQLPVAVPRDNMSASVHKAQMSRDNEQAVEARIKTESYTSIANGAWSAERVPAAAGSLRLDVFGGLFAYLLSFN